MTAELAADDLETFLRERDEAFRYIAEKVQRGQSVISADDRPRTQSDLIYTADVAEILGVDVRTVHRMVKRGDLIPAAIGRGTRGSMVFRRADVEALVKASKAGAA